MIEVFGDECSGNCLKVKWILEYLHRPFRWTQVDILRGETRTPEFLALNPASQVPVVVLEDGRRLAQSNAIVLYFCEGTPLVPSDPFDRARMLEWMFWEQYSHEPYLAVRRFQRLYLDRADAEIDPRLMERGTAALARMEAHLTDQRWLVGETLSAADVSLLPYTMLAPEGGFSLAEYPGVCSWIARASTALGIDAKPDGDGNGASDATS
ncbi:MAG: glutathione S-transferase family protein [Sphingobium sp.]|uniref:glutathione S-transferase family protein n=1 Tax=Sphingobium sp. TaxID=1912891 RepID=UPI0029ADC9EA|nr:glutathione S-transferase family protein [Sphingobium sp.]MDX3910678.1 glutathione S-transferase family protein [Sphingobium sp.]